MAAQENGNCSNGWRTLLGREVTLVRDRYGYRVNGQHFRRVTTLLAGIPKPALTGWAAKTTAHFAVEHKDSWIDLPRTDAIKLLKGAPWSRRDDAADRGSVIHAAVEAYLKGAELPDELAEEELDCAIAVEAFLRQHIQEVLGVELTVFSPHFQYAGTLDLWAMGRDRMKYILDWKSGRDVYPDHAVQLAAYANAEYAVINKRPVATNGAKREAWKGRLIAWGPARTERLGIVHVRPDGATVHPVLYSSRLWHVFRAASFVKLWQLDTDTYRRTPREPVFGEPVEVRSRSPRTSTAAA